MTSRRYNKRVEIWQSSSSSDGFGGSYNENVKLTTSWCKITTSNSLSRSTDFGITDTNDTIVLVLRKRNDITYNSVNQFFIYRGEKYILQGTPVNVGFEDREIQITLKRENKKEVLDIEPIGSSFFPYIFNFNLA